MNDTLYQHTDNEINVPITDEETGEAVSAASFIMAQYIIFNETKNLVFLEKSLGSGIAVDADNLVITLSFDEAKFPANDSLFHQLVVWNSLNQKLPPIFSNTIKIKRVIKGKLSEYPS